MQLGLQLIALPPTTVGRRFRDIRGLVNHKSGRIRFPFVATQPQVTKAEKLRFLEFLAILAGLIGIAVESSSGFEFPTSWRPYFLLYLVAFIAYSVVAYARILSGVKRSATWAILATQLFGILLAFLFSAVFFAIFGFPSWLGPNPTFAIYTIALMALFLSVMYRLATRIFRATA